MPKNSQYVIYAYSIAGTVIIVYAAALFFRLRRMRKKRLELKEKT